MIHQIIDINLDYTKLDFEKTDYQPKLYTYILDNSPEIDANRTRPTVVVCPGGGYEFTSDREAEAIAIRLNSQGFNAVVLRYSVAPSPFPTQLLELATSIALVRKNAKEWNVDVDKIIVMGFSAGGHLAASIGVHWDKDFVFEALNLTPQDVKPNALILSYAVISAGEYAHVPSFKNLLGKDFEKNLELVNLANHVSKNTPKSFLWHTFDDDVVPVENSMLFASELKKYDIPFELHVYPHGQHGLGLATEETHDSTGKAIQPECANWIDLAAVFIKNL